MAVVVTAVIIIAVIKVAVVKTAGVMAPGKGSGKNPENPSHEKRGIPFKALNTKGSINGGNRRTH